MASSPTNRVEGLVDKVNTWLQNLGQGRHRAEPEEDEASLLPDGERFGEFVVQSEIGRGAMGVVCAIQVSLGRTVALKVLPTALVSGLWRSRVFAVRSQPSPAMTSQHRPHCR